MSIILVPLTKLFTLSLYSWTRQCIYYQCKQNQSKKRKRKNKYQKHDYNNCYCFCHTVALWSENSFTDNMSLLIKDLLIKEVDIVKSEYCFNLKTITTATNE